MTRIPLRNKNNEIINYTIVDEEEFSKVNSIRWYMSNGYATNGKYGRLNRFIMNSKKGDPFIDHINNDKLDNRKINLRSVTISQNIQNRCKKEGTSSSYIGVSFFKRNEKWRCQCMNEYVIFDTETHAAYWYDQLAIKNFGNDAKINNIEKPENFVFPIKYEKSEKILPVGILLSKYNTYRTRIHVNKKMIHVGSFKTLEEAIEAQNKKKDEIENIRLANEIVRNKDGTAIIIASDNSEIMVDDDKYHELLKYKWWIIDGYAIAHINKKDTRMHRFLLNAKKGDIIDHINNIRIDNRINNLRFCSDSLNAHNKNKKEGATSKYIGVCIRNNMYRTFITKNFKQYTAGIFENEEDAARARDKKAIELYGKDAKLNFSV